ncbi:hypothetical protein B0H21DRAFT_219843 [Amylocystis lapponica]|nr:hypothetical protein B0H21DRAFT_219843 [Amylocystis lapponica]
MSLIHLHLRPTMSSNVTLQPALPTLDKLGVSLPTGIDSNVIASEWFRAFSQHAPSNDVEGLLTLFVEDGWWRDMLALTWEFRSFHGAAVIRKFLHSRLASTKLSSFNLGESVLSQPFPDLVWIQGMFDFETDVGVGTGVFRLVPQPDGIWRAHNICTTLDGLKAFPEKIGALRNLLPDHGKWEDKRAQERGFLDEDPKVIVVGGGLCGLDIAARLKQLDVPTLVIEKEGRVGDSWRRRYDALCLHDPVWLDHMPYLPFPPSWPAYTPARKFGNWLEFYADALELNVWTSSTVEHAERHEDNTWTATVRRSDGTERKLHVQHLVLALGWGGAPKWPNIPGQDMFAGKVLHSTMHKTGKDFTGKKVVVVGTGTSAHDISADCYENGADVTMVQRGPTFVISLKASTTIVAGLYKEGGLPVETADRLANSLPFSLLKFVQKRIIEDLTNVIDKPLLDGLKKAGFKAWAGPEGLGIVNLAWMRSGGYYIDVGTSQLIIDGKIKVKSDSQIERFTEVGLKFEDGSVLDADVVVFATGFEPPGSWIAKICGDGIASQVGPIWGLNEEGEARNAWRWLGVPNLWYMIGSVAMARYHSKFLALQIKAQLEGLHGTRYTE